MDYLLKLCICHGTCYEKLNVKSSPTLSFRKFDHPNVCKFIGATLHDIHPHMVIVTEYCPKGSLNDVLLNDAIPLNWNFRFTFAKDIARGMAYLHTHSLTHSRLTSSNCVIDDRWVTKITGMYKLYRNRTHPNNLNTPHMYTGICLWGGGGGGGSVCGFHSLTILHKLYLDKFKIFIVHIHIYMYV